MFMLDKMDGKVNKIVFVGTSVELTYELLLLRQIIVRKLTLQLYIVINCL